MNKDILMKRDEEGKAYFDINDFADVIDISKVAFYEWVAVEDADNFQLKFYDKDRKEIPFNEK